MKKLASVLIACITLPCLASVHMENFVVDGAVHHSYLADIRDIANTADTWYRDSARKGAYEVGVDNDYNGGQNTSGLIFWVDPQYHTHYDAESWMKNLSVADRKRISDYVLETLGPPGENAYNRPLWVRFRTAEKWTGANFYNWSPPTETSDAAPWRPPQACVIRVDVGEPVIGTDLADGLKWPVTTTRQCEYNGASFRTTDVRVMGDTDPDLKLEHFFSTPTAIVWWAVLRPITSVGEISKSLVLRIEWP